nr:16S rRNA (guanine(966)-N(2))-methyltransferase RsmD [Ottowia testudinis]
MRRTTTAPHEVRNIGGQWSRTKLRVADKPGLRPTPDRVRETLFNWLGQDLTGWRVVDAFAGTGALGLEAASRGAADVLLVEQDATLAAGLRALKERLKADAVRVQRGDGVAALGAQAPGSVDLVLLDPPFEAPALFAPALAAAARALQPQGFVYLEAPAAWDDAALIDSGLAIHRHLKAGAVHAHLLKRARA